MPDIYADSFSGITQGDLAYAGLRQRSLESALNNALGALSGMRNLAAQKEHWKQQALQAENELELRSSAANDQREYYEWLKKQPSKTQTKDRELDDAYLLDYARRTGEVLDLDDARRIAPNSSETAQRIALADARPIQAKQEREYAFAKALEKYINRKYDIDQQINALAGQNAELAKVPWTPFDPPSATVRAAKAKARSQANQELIAQLTAEKQNIETAIRPFSDNKILQNYVQPNLSAPGWVESSIPLPYHMRPRSRDLPSSMAAPRDILPEQTIPNRRTYGSGMPARRPNFVLNDQTPVGTEEPVTLPERTRNVEIRDPEPAPMIPPSTSTGTNASRVDWIKRRAQEMARQGIAPAEAVKRARLEYQGMFETR